MPIGQGNPLLNFLTKPGLCLAWVTRCGKSRPQAQWRLGSGTKRTVSIKENIESVQELVLSQGSPVHIDQCVKSQEKPTNIIIVIVIQFFLFFFGQTLEIVILVPKNWTINNSVNFQNFLTKFCVITAKLFSITSCKFCINLLRFSCFIMKRVGFQFFSDTLYIHCVSKKSSPFCFSQ